MDTNTRQMLLAVDARIANLQEIRRLVVQEFGEEANSDTPAPKRRRRSQAKRSTKQQTDSHADRRQNQMHRWLKMNGPAGRKEIIAGTGFPSGTVSGLLSRCPELFENRDGKWHAR